MSTGSLVSDRATRLTWRNTTGAPALEGDVVTLVAGGVGVAETRIEAGEEGALVTAGVRAMPAAMLEAMVTGALARWDGVAREVSAAGTLELGHIVQDKPASRFGTAARMVYVDINSNVGGTSTPLTHGGPVANLAALPGAGAFTGEIRRVTDIDGAGTVGSVVWDGDSWERLGGAGGGATQQAALAALPANVATLFPASTFTTVTDYSIYDATNTEITAALTTRIVGSAVEALSVVPLANLRIVYEGE